MSGKTVKLVVCDIDDTLVHKELHLQKSTVELIQEMASKGVMFTLATGRMPFRAESLAKEAGLTIPYIANNGSILCKGDTIIREKLLQVSGLRDVLRRYRKENPGFTILFSYSDCERPIARTKWIADRLHKYKGYDQALGDTDEVWIQEVHKVYVLDDERTGMIGRLSEELRNMRGSFNFFQYGEYSIEIVAKGCSKASGVSELLEYLQIPARQVMAIGDHTNDIEMVRMAGIGVSVANGDPKLKEAADYIASKERAEGVEEAIRKFVL